MNILFRQPLFLLALSGLLNSCYFLFGRIDPDWFFWLFQGVLWAQLILVWGLTGAPASVFTVRSLACVYVFSRLVLYLTDPIYEDDYFRYLWDAQVLDHGINPYIFEPQNPFLDFLKSSWRELVNFPEVKTIYPPVAQAYFWIVYKISGLSLSGLRWGAFALELSVAYFLSHLVPSDRRLKTAAVFLFFPTVMKENVNSVHFDLLAILPILAALVWARLWSVGLGLAIGAKIFPVILVPMFFLRARRKFIFLLSLGASLAILYLPFVDAGASLFQGTGTFAKEWRFFESFAALPIPGVRWILIAVSVVGVVAISFLKKPLELLIPSALTLVLVFSSVVNTWYWLWIIPFLVLRAPTPMWIFPVVTALGYSWFVDQSLYHVLHQPVYGLFLIAAVLHYLFRNWTTS